MKTSIQNYSGKAMIRKSNFMEYIYKLNADKKQWLSERVDELIHYYHEYCDEGNYRHLCEIFSAIALYEMLQEYGLSEPEAFEMIANTLEEVMEEEKESVQKLAKASVLWPIIRKVIPTEIKRRSGYGWKFTWHKDIDKSKLCFDCNECIYQKILMQSEKEKLTPLFCHAEEITFGDLPNIEFSRTGTLFEGAGKCSFCVSRKK